MPDEWSDELALFEGAYLANAEGIPYHKKWAAANPGEAAKWSAFRDSVRALSGDESEVQPAPPILATKYGKALVAAGEMHMSISRVVGQMRGQGDSPPTSPPAGVTPVLDVDFETGDFSQGYLYQQESSTGRITISSVDPIDGTYSALIKNSSVDVGVAGSGGAYRTEIVVAEPLRSEFGYSTLEDMETWIAWDQNLSSFQVSSGWCVITQFHGGTGSPVFAINVPGPAPGSLIAEIRGGAVNANYRTHTLATPAPLAQDLSFRVYHRWSPVSGQVKVWLNGVLKFTDTGPNLYNGFEGSPYHKVGVYRTASGVVGESQLKVDNIRYYDEDPGW